LKIIVLKPFNLRITAFLMMAVIAFSSCSTRKNNVVSRAYHDLTAHYNGYFNARERMNTGAKTLADAHKDRYDRILSIFKYADEQAAKAVFPDMDEAIKKSSVVIQRHSIYVKRKEHCKWIDENWIVIGRSQFYKHDFYTSIETFQYVAAEWKNDPSRYEALIWLAQAYLQLARTPDAGYLLDFMNNDPKLPNKMRPLFHAVNADFYLQKHENDNAIVELEKAAAMTKKKQTRNRYNYILAQLYQQKGDYEKAFALYQRVVRGNPDYEMAFNAKINRARSFDVNSPDAASIKKQLTRMLKDGKNTDYLDQIYYALAGISQKEKNDDQAISYLNKSIETSTSNTSQKAISYLNLAEIYFRKTDYKTSQAYYDSTMAILPQDYPDYTTVETMKTSLSKLIKYLNVIATEDSLQGIASLDVQAREAKINEIVDAEQEALEKKKELEEQEKQNQIVGEQQNAIFPGDNKQQNNNNNQAGGGWYFYNTATISFGYSEFLKKWGSRKLEDNWRRISKDPISATSQGDEENGDTLLIVDNGAYNDSIAHLKGSLRKEAYLKSLPVSPEKKAESDAKIVEAYYNLGIIYKEQLLNNSESAKTFEKLLERYPENKYKVAVYYNLNRLYLAMKDTAKAEYYKNLILDKYGDSEYAKIISNPNYFNEKQNKTAILYGFYENTYKAYRNKQYEDVIERKSLADSLFPGNKLAPKFDLLKAMAIGKTQPVDRFIASLNDIIIRYPQDSVRTRAQDILDYLNGHKSDGPPPATVDTIQGPAEYEYSADSAHFFMLIFDGKSADINKLKIRVSDYNREYFSTMGLNITASMLSPSSQYVLVKSFPSADDALTYITGIMTDEAVFNGIEQGTFRQFVISASNYAILFKDKDVDRYAAFYLQHYTRE
jgi:tetratricopeptide (TPR) repeat protein